MSENSLSQYAAVILAAGASSRFGSPKILLEWNEEVLVYSLCRKSLDAGLSPVRLVLGAYLDEPRKAINDLPVEIVVNPQWQQGMGSSFKQGIENLSDECRGVFLILGDMPYLEADLLKALILEPDADVVMPVFQGKRGHPVLWKRSALSQLNALMPNQSPRDALKGLRVKDVEWKNCMILNDIDTKEDLERIKKI